jgi:hypothetical protein
VGDNEAHVVTKNGPKKIKLSLSWELRKLRPHYDFIDNVESAFGQDPDASLKTFAELEKNPTPQYVTAV